MSSERRGGLPCPSCGWAMAEVGLDREDREDREAVVDACDRCLLVWFDAKERDVLPERPSSAATARPRPSHDEAEALFRLRSRGEREAYAVEVDPASAEAATGFFGVPTLVDGRGHDRTPWFTWAVAGAILLLFATGLALGLSKRGLSNPVYVLRKWWEAWGFVPADPWRRGGLTLLSKFFLHGSALHAIGNSYFLLLVGESVEGLLGRARYVLLLAAGAVVGGLFHAALHPGSEVPLIGASGGISALFGWYAVTRPKARLGFTLGGWRSSGDISRLGWHLPRWFQVRVRVVWVFVAWLVLEWLASRGRSSVAHGAHVGGALTGVAWGLVGRVRAAATAKVTDAV